MGFFLTLLIYGALFVLSDLLRPKSELETQKPAGLGDFRFPTATEQRPVPLIWGTVRIEGPNVIWYGDLIQEAITEEVKTGLFSSESITKGFRYRVGVQSALCMGPLDGPDDGLVRVWIADDLVADFTGAPKQDQDEYTIDEPELFGGEDLGAGGVVGTLKFFAGTNAQTVSDYLKDFQKEPPVTGDTPAYHDICYDAPATEPVLLGTSTSIKPWKRELRRIPNGLALSAAQRNINGGTNPANFFFEAITNADWGYGEDAATIDTSNFAAAASTLTTEENGFSFLLDRIEDIGDLVRRVEEQIDGILFQNPINGLWQIKLVRADYNILTVPELNATNIVDVPTFTRGTWEGTTNQVRVPFNQANDDYKDTYGFAQDMANVRIVGANTSATIVHPGVKEAGLASAIAWRELRTLAIPLAQGTFIADRSLYGVLPGDVVGFTDADIGFVRLPMRIKSVDYGELLNGRIKIQAVQDVFFAAAGVFDNPPPSGWVPPQDVLVAYPTGQQLAFEAPYALTLRDPQTTDPFSDKIYAAARRQGPEVQFLITERNAAGAPAGSFDETGVVVQFVLVGELSAALDLSGTNPVSSVTVVPDPDTQAAILNAFPSVTDLNELGNELLSLCLVDDEFFLVESSQSSASNVQLNNVHRGVLDSVQADHSMGAKVYLLFVGAGMSSGSVPAGNNVEVKLLPKSISDELDPASATAIAFTMDNRTRRPYPPASFDLNSTTLDTTNVDLDGSGSGENVGILVDEIVRRDFRIVNEVGALQTDAAALDASFPTANSTEVELEVRDGVTVLDSETGLVGTSTTMRQLDILAGLDTTPLPASLTIAVRQSHTLASTVRKSRVFLECTFTVASPFLGKHAFGELDDGEISNSFVVVADTVDHVFNLSTSFAVGDVEYRINGGSFLTLITAGGTGPGTIPNASLSVSDTIEIRHQSSDTNPQKLLTMTVSGTEEAYAVMIS